MKLPSFDPSPLTPVPGKDAVGVFIQLPPTVQRDAKTVPFAGSYRIPAAPEDKDLASLHGDVVVLLVDADGPTPFVRGVVPAVLVDEKLPERLVEGHRVGAFTLDLFTHFGLTPIAGGRYHVVASLRRWTSPLATLSVAG